MDYTRLSKMYDKFSWKFWRERPEISVYTVGNVIKLHENQFRPFGQLDRTKKKMMKTKKKKISKHENPKQKYHIKI